MKKDLQFFAAQWRGMSKRGRVVFSVYILFSMIVAVFYILYGYSFWYTDKATGLVNISACVIFLYIMYLQFNPFARVGIWLLMPCSGFSMFTFSHFQRFDISVIYMGLILMAMMMPLAAWLNWFLKKDSNALSDS